MAERIILGFYRFYSFNWEISKLKWVRIKKPFG